MGPLQNSRTFGRQRAAVALLSLISKRLPLNSGCRRASHLTFVYPSLCVLEQHPGMRYHRTEVLNTVFLILHAQVACLRMFREPISWVRSLNGWAMPWPRGPFQPLRLHFSHFVSLGCKLFTTTGKLFNGGISVLFPVSMIKTP